MDLEGLSREMWLSRRYGPGDVGNGGASVTELVLCPLVDVHMWPLILLEAYPVPISDTTPASV